MFRFLDAECSHAWDVPFAFLLKRLRVYLSVGDGQGCGEDER